MSAENAMEMCPDHGCEEFFCREMHDADAIVHQLREAIRLMREYAGERIFPAHRGWDWYKAINATGGFEGFGHCACVLDPAIVGRDQNANLLYCSFPAAPSCETQSRHSGREEAHRCS